MNTFTLPDAFVAAPLSTFEFDPVTVAKADALLAADPVALFRRLLRDQESEPVLLAARRVLHGFLSRHPRVGSRPAADSDAIAERVGRFREVITAILDDLPAAEPAVREAVLRQRAPLALLGGCWLDVVSQPATQPATIVNRLIEHQLVWQGEGNPRRRLHHTRHRALESAGVFLPEIAAGDFMRMAEARPLTALHGAFYLSLAKLPANFLPEVIGVHYGVTALGIDDLLLGMPPMLSEPELRSVLAEYLRLAGTRPELGARVANAAELALTLELEHTGMLAGLAAWRGGRSLDASPNRVGDREAAAWSATLAVEPPADVVLRRANVPDDRQFLHRLVNIENYPNTIDLAREHATVVLDIAEEVLFEHGAAGVLTDASWFDYTADALRDRVDRICQDTLKDEARLGCGNVALGSMGIRAPRFRDAAFLDQAELPAHRYELSIQQLSLSLFPNTFYDEILGFNLGISMLRLEPVRARELPRPRRHWLDIACDDAHPSIDETPSGHPRQSAEIIIDYLDDVAMTCGPDAVREHWRRIWRGYASFAYLVEPEPLGSVPGPADPMTWSLFRVPEAREQSTTSVRR